MCLCCILLGIKSGFTYTAIAKFLVLAHGQLLNGQCGPQAKSFPTPPLESRLHLITHTSIATLNKYFA